MKVKAKMVILFGMLICLYSVSNAQYGPPPPYGPPPRRSGHNQSDDGVSRPSGYVSVNFGFATPEGGYASSVGPGYGGYALPGDVFHLSIGVPINHSNFGLAFMFANYNNQYDLNTYANNNAEYAIFPDQNFYSESSIMGGLYVTYPVGILSFDGRLMVGALLSSLPEQDYGYDDAQGDSYQYDLQASNSTSLAFDAGVGIRCLIARFGRRKLCAMVNVDYLYSSVPYNSEQIINEIPATGPNAGYQVQLVPSPVFSGHLPVELMNITFGLGYQI